MSALIALAWPLVALVALALVAWGVVTANVWLKWAEGHEARGLDISRRTSAAQGAVDALANVTSSLEREFRDRLEKLESTLKVSPPPVDRFSPEKLARFK